VGARFLSVLRSYPAVFRLWLAQAVSLVGDWFTLIALSVLVSAETRGSGLAVSGLLLVQILPTVVVGPLAGVLADTLDRKRLLVAIDLIRAVIVLAFVLASGSGRLPLLYALAFLHFSVSTVFEPTRAALLPRLVRGDDLVAASTLSTITWSVMTALGGAIGGFVLAAVGVRAAFVVDSLTFLVSAALIAPIPASPPADAQDGPARGRVTFLEGVRWAIANPGVGSAALVKIINGLALVDTFLVLYGTRLFVVGNGGSISVGLLYASFGAGAVLGPLVLGRFNDGTIPRMRRLLTAGSVLITAGLLLLRAAGSLPVAALAIMLRGMGGSSNWTWSTLILQKGVPNRLLGRLVAIDLANAMFAAALSSIAWGYGIDRAGVRPMVLAAAAISVPAIVAWAYGVRWMERRERTTTTTGTA
jgi:predicted MFS family arabinose efflux permease